MYTVRKTKVTEKEEKIKFLWQNKGLNGGKKPRSSYYFKKYIFKAFFSSVQYVWTLEAWSGAWLCLVKYILYPSTTLNPHPPTQGWVMGGGGGRQNLAPILSPVLQYKGIWMKLNQAVAALVDLFRQKCANYFKCRSSQNVNKRYIAVNPTIS